MKLRTRAGNGNDWSALHTVFFQIGGAAVGPGDLGVSELHYNPAGPDDAEFLEWVNRSDHAVNVRGCRLTHGVEFAFPPERDHLLAPGERFVLVRDLFAFQQRYGIAIPVAGVYRGSLNNDGETLVFVDARGATVAEVGYGVVPPWPGEANDAGYSLVAAPAVATGADPLAWRASARPHGAPGANDTERFTGAADEDLDGDGWNRLAEYAMGTSDVSVTDPGPLELRALPDGAVGFELKRNPVADEVRLWVEWSFDLNQWRFARRVSQERNALGTLSETWSGPPGSGSAALFLRVLVRRGP
jgi:Lamin Tail Domain